MQASDLIKTDPTLLDALDLLLDGPPQISMELAETVFDKLDEGKAWQKGILPVLIDVHGDRVKVGFATGNPTLDRAFKNDLKPVLGMFAANITFGDGAFTMLATDMRKLTLADTVRFNNSNVPLGAEVRTLQLFVRRMGQPDIASAISVPLAPVLAL